MVSASHAESLESIISRFAGRGRDALLPALWAIQTASGHINLEAVRALSLALNVPEADIYGVIGFYSMFHDQPTGETIIRVCTSPSCGLAGSDDLLDHVCQRLGVEPGQTTSDGRYTVEETTCLGLCEHAPAALVSQRGVGERSVPSAVDLESILADHSAPYPAVTGSLTHLLLDGIPVDRAQTLAEYGDYSALRRTLNDLMPDEVVAKIQASGLLGRGGAAFPTGLKWEMARRSEEKPHYVICNADESEPGTFKDRVLMELRPHLLLEGLALCAYAIEAEQGYLFIRGEYPLATQRLQQAIDAAVASGYLGDNIMGSGFNFHVEIRRGAGAYICGEETALFEAIEGKRGFPRIKPPYPTRVGLFGKPTVINNVETLCKVPGIINRGGRWFRQWGTDLSTGVKLVSVSGHVSRPGVYEIPLGTPLRQVLTELCGGVTGRLQAVLMGGAAGTFLAPDEIDTPLTFEDLRTVGSTLGSGAIMVFNDSVDLRDVLRRLGAFFQHESCGKCYPCQLGTQRQKEILDRLHAPLPGDRERLTDIGQTMSESSLCGLGQTAAAAVLSAMKRWPHLFE